MATVKIGDVFKLLHEQSGRFFTVIGFSDGGATVVLRDTALRSDGTPWRHTLSLKWMLLSMERDDALPYSHRS